MAEKEKVAKCGYSSRVCAAVKILQLIDALQNSHIFCYIYRKLKDMHVSECRAVRSGAAGAARAAPLFVAKFVIIVRVHSVPSGTTPH